MTKVPVKPGCLMLWLIAIVSFIAIASIAFVACTPIRPIPPTPIPTAMPAPAATMAAAARPAAAAAINRPTATVTPTPTPDPALPATVNDLEVISQLSAANTACDQDKTSAQQERALEAPRAFFVGRQISLTGIINDVRSLSTGYDAIVELEKIDSDSTIDLSEELALSLNRGDRVLLEGELEIKGCWFYNDIKGTLTLLD